MMSEELKPIFEHLAREHPGDAARLTRIRAQARAVAEQPPTVWWSSRRLLAAALTLCAVTLLVWQLGPHMRPHTIDTSISVATVEWDDTMVELASSASLDLYEELDFVLWLAEQPDSETS